MDYHRQLGIFNPNEFREQKIEIIGAGAIGSATAFTLAKLGLGKLTVWDDDKVENHNLPNQLYAVNSLHKPKVLALREMVKTMTGFDIEVKNSRYQPHDWNGEFVIVTVDNMLTRREVFDLLKLKASVKGFIDARMGGEVMRIYSLDTMNPTHISSYEKTLYTDEQASELPCTERSIIYNLMGISSFITNNVKKKLMREDYENEIIFDYKTMIMEKTKW